MSSSSSSTSSLTPVTSSSSTILPHLPTELWLKIWEFALPGPRIVYVKERRQSRERALGWWKRVRSDRAIGCINQAIRRRFKDSPAHESTGHFWERDPLVISSRKRDFRRLLGRVNAGEKREDVFSEMREISRPWDASEKYVLANSPFLLRVLSL
jgi:hypothetical protein